MQSVFGSIDLQIAYSLQYNTDNSAWFSRMVQRAIPPVINGYLATLTTSSSITCVQHGQQRMVQRAIPPVINGYLTTLTTSHPSRVYNTDNSAWLPRHTHYLLIHHVCTTRTTADGSACDPSRYKWLPRHTHYLSSITCVQHGQQHMVQRAIPPVINGYLATLTTSHPSPHGSACDPSRYKWLPHHTHYLLIHHMSTLRTTADGSACDPSRYKWLPRHTHYLSSITCGHHTSEEQEFEESLEVFTKTYELLYSKNGITLPGLLLYPSLHIFLFRYFLLFHSLNKSEHML
ncbi:hypothetical protein J6590_025635 [Homalodisca vitripennis]|nr:hypothetical protein J6590_025635 [Homalodisca vitripennis]